MQNPIVHRFHSFCIGLILLLAGFARAETFRLNDGQTLSGEPISFNEQGLIVRLEDGKLAERAAWTKFSQEDLKKIAQNPKATQYVEPFIEVTPEERIQKTAVPLKDVPRLERPPAQSLFGALFTSAIGWVIMFALYVANIYAAYEVSIFRAQPAPLVCGLAAIPVLGLLSPIIFLSMPTRMKKSHDEEVWEAAPHEYAEAEAAVAAAEELAGEAPASGLSLAQRAEPAAAAHAPATIYQRGQFTFNRRFFETKFPGFFGIVKREAEKDIVLVLKTSRGEYVGQRISRIAASDIHLQVQKGRSSEEVMIPFIEIQEIQLKHKDA